jgi:hypothetical protein
MSGAAAAPGAWPAQAAAGQIKAAAGNIKAEVDVATIMQASRLLLKVE